MSRYLLTYNPECLISRPVLHTEGRYIAYANGEVRKANGLPAYIKHQNKQAWPVVVLCEPGVSTKQIRVGRTVARVIWEAFHGEELSRRLAVKPLDGNLTNTRLLNLEAGKIGNDLKKLSDRECVEIRRRIRKEGHHGLLTKIAREEGVSVSLIEHIRNGTRRRPKPRVKRDSLLMNTLARVTAKPKDFDASLAIGTDDEFRAKPLPPSLQRTFSRHIARTIKTEKTATALLTDACHEECASQSRLLMLTDAYLRTRPGTPAARVALDRLMEVR